MSAIKGNPELDFKEQNQIISQLSAFKSIYDKKPKEASKVCWAMFMIEEADTNVNPLARIGNYDERVKEVQEAYYKVDVKSEAYKLLVSDFSKFILSKEESLFRIHVTKFEELTAYLQGLSLDVEKDFKQYMEIMNNLPKMWKGLEDVKTKMIEAKNKTTIRGNAQLSARDKRKR